MSGSCGIADKQFIPVGVVAVMRSRICVTLWLWTLVSVVLCGCTATIPLQESPSSNAHIVVLTPGVTSQFLVYSGSDVKGLIPFYGFAKVIEGEYAENSVREELHASGFNIGVELQQALVRELAGMGYLARPESVERSGSWLPPFVDPGDLQGKEDAWAYMDSRVNGYGFSGEVTGELRPYIGVSVRLIDARSKRILYARNFAYNAGVGGNVVKVPFEPNDQWANFATLKNDILGVRDALANGASRIATAVAGDMDTQATGRTGP